MSDHWEYFPCEMGEHTAFVFYDHGIRKKITDPGSAGSGAHHRAVEKSAGRRASQGNRNTMRWPNWKMNWSRRSVASTAPMSAAISINGARHFYCYVNAGSVRIETMAKRLAQKTGYPVGVDVSDDPEKNAYWNTLYPTKRDWLLIQDLHLMEELEGRGDTLDKPREIGHHARFETGRAAKKFRAWLESEGFEVKGRIKREEDRRHGVHFSHVCRPVLGDVTRYTFDLFSKAEQLGGRYDGWETDVAEPPKERAKPRARA